MRYGGANQIQLYKLHYAYKKTIVTKPNEWAYFSAYLKSILLIGVNSIYLDLSASIAANECSQLFGRFNKHFNRHCPINMTIVVFYTQN